MPIALTTLPEPPIPLIPPRKRWTRAECAQLASAGILDYEYLELIEGELIDKMGKHRPHIVGLAKIADWLRRVFGQDRVNSEAAIDVAPADNPINEPEPDVIVFQRAGGAYEYSIPQSADLTLVVEVSDSTLRFDLTVKAALYTRAGIVDYWVLDINGRRLIVHRDPTPAGYGSVVAYGESESVSPLTAPDRELLVSAIFPA
jgi:Uma2 family endonuclease